MAQIQNSQLPFNDSATNGNVVDQTSWNQAIQVIQAAVNDNFYRRLADVKVLNADGSLNTTATLQAASGITNELEMQMGNGITITPTVSNGVITLQFSVANGALTGAQLANLTVTAQQIANNTITATQIANNTITAGQIANNTITETQMAAGSIGTTELQNASVTTAKIANGAVGSTQIASQGVAQANIANGAVGTNQLDPALLNTTTLNQHRTLNPIDHPDGSVTASKLAYDAVNPTMLQTRVSPNLVDNAHFENVTSTATVFSDALTSYTGSIVPAPWTLQSGSFTFGASGATSGASTSAMTAGNAQWKPVLGSDGSTKLALKASATFTTPSSIPTTNYLAKVYLFVNSTNYYMADLNENGNFYIHKMTNGSLSYVANTTFSPAVSTTYTITIQLDNTGALTATITPSGGSTTTLTYTDSSPLTGGFLIGVGGDTGVVISNASVTGPWANAWTIGGDSRVAWGLTQSAIGGKYSVSAVGVANVEGYAGQLISYSASTTYTVSGYISATNAGASPNQATIEYDLSSGTIYAYVPSGTVSTERINASGTSPSSTGSVNLYLVTRTSGEYTFDNIQLEQGSTATPFIPKVQRPATPLDLDPASTIGLANIVRSLGGGWKVQSGSISAALGANTVTFSSSFSSNPFVFTQPVSTTDTNTATPSGISTSGFTLNSSAATTVDWFAIGQ